ncbi:MAG: hypothetical protein LUC92_10695 [Clostridiales bacterium]|nr:hypothetical protein [Clostridiales bacterium]
MRKAFNLKKALCLFFAAAVIFTQIFTQGAWASSDYARGFNNNYGLKNASEVGSGKIWIEGRADTCITANTEKGYLYIVDAKGNKQIDRLFTSVFNGMFLNRYLIVRFYGTDDFSGFGVLAGAHLYTLVPNDNYYYISAKYFRGANNLICEKRDGNGELTAVYYRFDSSYNLTGTFNYDASYAPDNYLCTTSAKDGVKAADDDGLLINTLRYRDLSDDITRYELACLGVQAVLKKSGKNIYEYVSENNIPINYNKYDDIVSPDVLVAEYLGLVSPGSGGCFHPETNVTREEVACALYRLCQLFGVETTSRSSAFEDESEIASSSRAAVNAVTGTKSGDTYIMSGGTLSAFQPNEHYSLEKTLISIDHVYDFGSFQTSSETYDNKKYIGCGTYLFQNSMKKWGAVNEDGKVIVEPVYELAGAYINLAVNNIFVLSDENNNYNDRNNTYYVFDTEGNLLKTLHYGAEEMEADGQSNVFTYVYGASGSNLVFWTHYGDNIADPDMREGFAFMKRLMSEKVAATEYDKVVPYNGDGLLKAEIPSTGEKVLLNPDGTFKEYLTEEE